MNVTPYFVFVHMPKTGGTFVAQVLREIDTPDWIQPKIARKIYFRVKNTLVRTLKIQSTHLELEKHATCGQIPKEFQHLPILSCMRNPFDWYVSNYRFQSWLRNPAAYPGLVDDPNWPELNFEHFLYLSNHEWIHSQNPDMNISRDLGRLTTIFVKFYCKNPNLVLEPNLPEETRLERFKENLFKVTYLDITHLNQALYDFLMSSGYVKENLEFILRKPRISPWQMRSADDYWESYYSEDLFKEILYRDRLLFALFPQYAEEAMHAKENWEQRMGKTDGNHIRTPHLPR